jgi:ZIP family zinc transporter
MTLPENFLTALIITLLAGLATAIGGAVAFVIKPGNMKALSVGLGFSAGVMIFLSFSEILPEAKTMLTAHFVSAEWLVMAGFVAGLVIAALIDYFVPDHINQQELFECRSSDEHFVQSANVGKTQEKDFCKKIDPKIRRAGVFTAIAICVHNFPEGMATFLAASQNFTLGLSVGIAIAIHNIPEGIAVALPVYNATGKKRYAMLYSSLSGLSEPLGALIGVFLFQLFVPQILVGFLFATVAGIMIYISFDTLLPLAKEYGDWHLSMIGSMSGMLFIWATTLCIM